MSFNEPYSHRGRGWPSYRTRGRNRPSYNRNYSPRPPFFPPNQNHRGHHQNNRGRPMGRMNYFNRSSGPTFYQHYNFAPFAVQASRPPSPLPGSEEYTQREIQEKSAFIKKQLDIEQCGDDNNLNSPATNQSVHKLKTTPAYSRSPSFFSNFNVSLNIPSKLLYDRKVQEEPTCSSSPGKQNSKQTIKQNLRKPAKPQDVYNVHEIHEKIISHICSLSYGKKINLVNQLGPTGYDAAIEQIQKQKRLELSRALREIANSQFKQNHDNTSVINAIIPDFSIKIETLPREVIAELSSTLHLDGLLPAPVDIDPEIAFRQAQDMLSVSLEPDEILSLEDKLPDLQNIDFTMRSSMLPQKNQVSSGFQIIASEPNLLDSENSHSTTMQYTSSELRYLQQDDENISGNENYAETIISQTSLNNAVSNTENIDDTTYNTSEGSTDENSLFLIESGRFKGNQKIKKDVSSLEQRCVYSEAKILPDSPLTVSSATSIASSIVLPFTYDPELMYNPESDPDFTTALPPPETYYTVVAPPPLLEPEFTMAPPPVEQDFTIPLPPPEPDFTMALPPPDPNLLMAIPPPETDFTMDIALPGQDFTPILPPPEPDFATLQCPDIFSSDWLEQTGIGESTDENVTDLKPGGNINSVKISNTLPDTQQLVKIDCNLDLLVETSKAEINTSEYKMPLEENLAVVNTFKSFRISGKIPLLHVSKKKTHKVKSDFAKEKKESTETTTKVVKGRESSAVESKLQATRETTAPVVKTIVSPLDEMVVKELTKTDEKQDPISDIKVDIKGTVTKKKCLTPQSPTSHTHDACITDDLPVLNISKKLKPSKKTDVSVLKGVYITDNLPIINIAKKTKVSPQITDMFENFSTTASFLPIPNIPQPTEESKPAPVIVYENAYITDNLPIGNLAKKSIVVTTPPPAKDFENATDATMHVPKKAKVSSVLPLRESSSITDNLPVLKITKKVQVTSPTATEVFESLTGKNVTKKAEVFATKHTPLIITETNRTTTVSVATNAQENYITDNLPIINISKKMKVPNLPLEDCSITDNLPVINLLKQTKVPHSINDHMPEILLETKKEPVCNTAENSSTVIKIPQSISLSDNLPIIAAKTKVQETKKSEKRESNNNRNQENLNSRYEREDTQKSRSVSREKRLNSPGSRKSSSVEREKLNKVKYAFDYEKSKLTASQRSLHRCKERYTSVRNNGESSHANSSNPDFLLHPQDEYKQRLEHTESDTDPTRYVLESDVNRRSHKHKKKCIHKRRKDLAKYADGDATIFKKKKKKKKHHKLSLVERDSYGKKLKPLKDRIVMLCANEANPKNTESESDDTSKMEDSEVVIIKKEVLSDVEDNVESEHTFEVGRNKDAVLTSVAMNRESCINAENPAPSSVVKRSRGKPHPTYEKIVFRNCIKGSVTTQPTDIAAKHSFTSASFENTSKPKKITERVVPSNKLLCRSDNPCENIVVNIFNNITTSAESPECLAKTKRSKSVESYLHTKNISPRSRSIDTNIKSGEQTNHGRKHKKCKKSRSKSSEGLKPGKLKCNRKTRSKSVEPGSTKQWLVPPNTNTHRKWRSPGEKKMIMDVVNINCDPETENTCIPDLERAETLPQVVNPSENVITSKVQKPEVLSKPAPALLPEEAGTARGVEINVMMVDVQDEQPVKCTNKSQGFGKDMNKFMGDGLLGKGSQSNDIMSEVRENKSTFSEMASDVKSEKNKTNRKLNNVPKEKSNAKTTDTKILQNTVDSTKIEVFREKSSKTDIKKDALLEKLKIKENSHQHGEKRSDSSCSSEISRKESKSTTRKDKEHRDKQKCLDHNTDSKSKSRGAIDDRRKQREERKTYKTVLIQTDPVKTPANLALEKIPFIEATTRRKEISANLKDTEIRLNETNRTGEELYLELSRTIARLEENNRQRENLLQTQKRLWQELDAISIASFRNVSSTSNAMTAKTLKKNKKDRMSSKAKVTKTNSGSAEYRNNDKDVQIVDNLNGTNSKITEKLRKCGEQTVVSLHLPTRTHIQNAVCCETNNDMVNTVNKTTTHIGSTEEFRTNDKHISSVTETVSTVVESSWKTTKGLRNTDTATGTHIVTAEAYKKNNNDVPSVHYAIDSSIVSSAEYNQNNDFLANVGEIIGVNIESTKRFRKYSKGVDDATRSSGSTLEGCRKITKNLRSRSDTSATSTDVDKENEKDVVCSSSGASLQASNRKRGKDASVNLNGRESIARGSSDSTSKSSTRERKDKKKLAAPIKISKKRKTSETLQDHKTPEKETANGNTAKTRNLKTKKQKEVNTETTDSTRSRLTRRFLRNQPSEGNVVDAPDVQKSVSTEHPESIHKVLHAEPQANADVINTRKRKISQQVDKPIDDSVNTSPAKRKTTDIRPAGRYKRRKLNISESSRVSDSVSVSESEMVSNELQTCLGHSSPSLSKSKKLIVKVVRLSDIHISQLRESLKIVQEDSITPSVVDEPVLLVVEQSDDASTSQIEHIDSSDIINLSNDDDVVFVREDNEDHQMNFADITGVVLVIKIIDDTIIAASDKGWLYCFDILNGNLIHEFKCAKKAITSLYPLKNEDGEDTIYTGSLDYQLGVFNYNKKEIVNTIKLEEGVQCLEYCWGYIFIGTEKGLIIRYNVLKEKVEDSVEISTVNVLVLKATQEGARRVLVVATRNAPVSVRDAMSGLLLRTMEPSICPTVYTVLFDQNLVYCGTGQHDILVYTFEDGQLVFRHDATKSKGVVCIQIVGNLLFAGCYDGNIYIYNTKTNTHLGTMKGPGGLLLCMEIINNKIIVGTKSHNFRAWRIPQKYLDYN